MTLHTELLIAMPVTSREEHAMHATTRVFEQGQHQFALIVPEHVVCGKRDFCKSGSGVGCGEVFEAEDLSAGTVCDGGESPCVDDLVSVRV
jgi:hypothetical protein